MGFFRKGRLNDFLGRQADTLIADIHSTIARAEGDLFRPVGMPIKSGLAHHKLKTAAQFIADRIHGGTDILQTFGFVRHRFRNTRWATVLTMHGAHDLGPFASRHARLCGVNRGGHDIAPCSCIIAQSRQSCLDSGAIACGAPRSKAPDLVGLNGRINNHDPALFIDQRRRF